MIYLFAFISTFAFACDCDFISQGRVKYLGKVINAESCRGKILDSLYEDFKKGGSCSDKIEVDWKCSGKYEKKSFSCSTFADLLDAESTFVATSVAVGTLSASHALAPDALFCTKEESQYSTVSNGLILPVASKEELKQIMARIAPKQYPGDIFDKIDNYSVELSLANDNNRVYNALTDTKSSNDKANTHSYSYKIEKKLNDEGYLLEVSWKSDLFTSYTNPRKPDYYKDANNVTHVSQYFIEENLAKIAIKKEKDGDKVFWSVGGGVHELNKDDPDRFIMFSGLTQQQKYHEWKIDNHLKNGDQKIITKMYNNTPQEGSELSAFIEGSVGKRETIDILSGSRIRTFVEAEAGARLTGIKDASSVSAGGSLNLDVKLIAGTAARLSAGARGTVYANGDRDTEKFIDVTVGTKNVQVGYRYTQNDRMLTSYQNPLPQTYVFRKEDGPPKNDSHKIYLRVAW